jgi:hypothetical protein
VEDNRAGVAGENSRLAEKYCFVKDKAVEAAEKPGGLAGKRLFVAEKWERRDQELNMLKSFHKNHKYQISSSISSAGMMF